MLVLNAPFFNSGFHVPFNLHDFFEETDQSHDDETLLRGGGLVSDFWPVGYGSSKVCGVSLKTNLGGGFKYFLFSPLFGEDSHFD